MRRREAMQICIFGISPPEENRNDAACLSVIVSGGKPYNLLRGIIPLLDWHHIYVSGLYFCCVSTVGYQIVGVPYGVPGAWGFSGV
jgi:hypothetical protein